MRSIMNSDMGRNVAGAVIGLAVVAMKSIIWPASGLTMTLGANCGSISTTSAPMARALSTPSRIEAPRSFIA